MFEILKADCMSSLIPCRFINYQADAIRRTDPHAQVTAGAWSPNTITDQFGLTNLYKDECLTKAGGKRLVSFKRILRNA